VTSTGDPNSRGSEGETLLVPLVADAVRTVDLEAGVVDVSLEFLDAR
jgi:ribosomal 30S subunit maturation factor RimM